MSNIEKELVILYDQLDHINTNNKDDNNYEDQISYVAKKISDLEEEKVIYRYDGPLYIFQYDGPVYRFNNYVSEIKNVYTSALSKEKAIANLIFKLKKKYGYLSSANLMIDEKKIKRVI